MGGILHQELKSALFSLSDAPRLHGILAGVGGVNVPSSKIQQMMMDCSEAPASIESVWME